MVGYDLDGVLASKIEFDISYFKANGEQRKEITKAREAHYRAAQWVLSPFESEYVVITSRKPKYACVTNVWLLQGSVKPKAVYFMDLPRTRLNMIVYKAFKINELGLKKYYEDDPKIVKALIKKCPNTEIIQIKPTIITYHVKKSKEKTLLF